MSPDDLKSILNSPAFKPLIEYFGAEATKLRDIANIKEPTETEIRGRLYAYETLSSILNTLLTAEDTKLGEQDNYL
jgi:hypothetical protein